MISEDMNASFEEAIPKEKLFSMLSSPKKGKSLGLDGLIVESYLGLYDHIK